MKLFENFRSYLGSLFGASVVRGFWHGQPLSALHWACLRSFLEAGHKFELYSYQALHVPEGVWLRSASEIVPSDRLFFLNNPHTHLPDVAPFADYFRLKVLFEQGGWWCDIDTVCLSRNLPRAERIWARQAPEYRPESVSNGQLFFKKNDWVAGRLLDACERALANIERRESLGPELISRVLAEMDLPLDMGATAATFYPLRYIEIFKLWLPEFREEVVNKVRSATFLPIYQSFPIHLGFDSKKLPPTGSFLHEFIRRKAPEFSNVSHDAEEFRRAVRKWFSENQSWAMSRLISVSGSDIVDWVQL